MVRFHSPAPFGKVAERSNATDCKSVGLAFDGSNPSLPTKKRVQMIALFFLFKYIIVALFHLNKIFIKMIMIFLNICLLETFPLPFDICQQESKYTFLFLIRSSHCILMYQLVLQTDSVYLRLLLIK